MSTFAVGRENIVHRIIAEILKPTYFYYIESISCIHVFIQCRLLFFLTVCYIGQRKPDRNKASYIILIHLDKELTILNILQRFSAVYLGM